MLSTIPTTTVDPVGAERARGLTAWRSLAHAAAAPKKSLRRP